MRTSVIAEVQQQFNFSRGQRGQREYSLRGSGIWYRREGDAWFMRRAGEWKETASVPDKIARLSARNGDR